MYAEFNLTDADLAEIKQEVALSGKYLRWFEVEIKSADGTVVAIVKKQIYVRAKAPALQKDGKL